MTTKVPWAYGFADELRARGKMVVLGGIHPTALPDEAALHADAVVVGEAESVWADVLSDASSGLLKPFYYGERLPLDDMPLPLTGLLKGRYVFRALFTKRGCPGPGRRFLFPGDQQDGLERAEVDLEALLVIGQVVIATDYYKTFVTQLRNLVGGEMKSAMSLMSRARREAMVRLLEQARTRGATEVWNVRLQFTSISPTSFGAFFQ